MKKIYEKYMGKISSERTNKSRPNSGYYEAAQDWYHDKYELVSISRDRYRILSLGLILLLALSMSSLMVMLPLKQYIYRLIEVNQQTGEITELKQTDSKLFSQNWVVSRYFIHQYVLNRHLYSYDDIKRTFNLALAMSSKSIAEEYSQMIIDTNPTSPLNILNNEYYRDVNILGINQLNNNTALVRFRVITHHKSNVNETKTEDLQAIVKWTFENPEESLKDRDLNPLGFYVNYYQVSPINSIDVN